MYIALRDQLKHYFYKKPLIWNALEFAQGLQYWWEYHYYYKWNLTSRQTSIRELNVEFSSACNLRCSFCGLDHNKPRVNINNDVLEKLLKTLLYDSRFRKVQVLNLYNAGETLLHPKRLEMFELVARYKKKAQLENLHFPEVWMVTNGMLLRENLSRKLLEMQVLDHLRLSVDGGTPEKFESMRQNAKWPIFSQNVRDFHRLNLEMGHTVKMSSISIIENDRPLNTDWMDADFADLLQLMDHIELRRAHNWAGEMGELEPKQMKKHKIGCGMLMHQMVVLPNGDVTVCCNDLNSKGVIGSLKNEELFEIYKGQNRRLYLDTLFKRQKKDLPLCAECETF